jgi:cellulose synthase/poly-beta-1,6-N-acetylglucosamine synthase-like glycosyltransferase
MQIAIIIPVFRRPANLTEMLDRLLADPYPHKQIIVAVDGPLEPGIAAALAPYRGRVRVDSDGEHRGKAQTLNRVVPAIEAEVLVFLDNDLKLSRRPDLLDRLARGMESCDLLELPKQAEASNWLSDLVAFEFLDNAIMAWLFTRLAGHCPGMNGSAFAVRKTWFLRLGGFRRVIQEDSDFAARAFQEWARFGFDPELQVQTEVPLTLSVWFHQRRRWALNNLFWLKDNLSNVALHALQSPRLLLSFLIFALPFFLIPLCFFVMRSSHVSFLLPSLFMLVQHEHGLAGLFLSAAHFHLITKGGFLPVMLAFAFSLGLHYGFARFLHFRFKFWSFVVYYFVYAPVWIIISLVFWLQLAVRGHLEVDWKI